MAPTERPTPSGPIAPDLRIVESRVYRGGNIWSYEPAIHLVVDLGVLEDYPSDTIDGFTDRLLELLPALENHGCSRGVKGGFIERLREGTWLGHVAEHVATSSAAVSATMTASGWCSTKSASRRPTRSKVAPAGSAWTTAPETSKGA